MDEILILDGYNVIFAWPALNERMQNLNLEAARELLMDWMTDFRGATGVQIIVVFDAHSSATATALPTETSVGGIGPVFTAREQTADSYIEKLVEQLRRQDKRRVIRVVTGDALEQGTVLSFGAARMTVRELRTRVAQSRDGTRAHMEKLKSAKRHELTGRLPQDIADALEVMRRS